MTIKRIFLKGLMLSIVVVLGAVYAVPCSGQEVADEDYDLIYSIAADGVVNIRQSPSADAPIVGRLLTGGAGAHVDALSSSGMWYKVNCDGVEGYVNALYVSGDPNAERVPNANAKRTVYYVVIGSYSNLDEVKAARYYMPDAIDGSPVFLGKKDGKTTYRMCSGMYYSRDEAQREVNTLKEFFGFTPWIWKSKGQAQCVDRPIGNDGLPVRITP